MGSVTYFATRECLDLISGKESDIVEVVEGCCRTEADEGGVLMIGDDRSALIKCSESLADRSGCIYSSTRPPADII